jgi:hypothetical protein
VGALGAPGGPSGSTGSHVTRATYATRSSTSQLPVVAMPAAATDVSGGGGGGTGAAGSSAGANTVGGAASGAASTQLPHRLRQSQQSLLDEAAGGNGAAGPSAGLPSSVHSGAGHPLAGPSSRELGRPSDSLGLSSARHRWRSPRAPTGVVSPGLAAAAAAAASGGGGDDGPGGGDDGPSGHPAELPHAHSGEAGAGGLATSGGGAPAGARDGGKDSRPAVMAECYKITQQPAGGPGGAGGEVAQSITVLKYFNLKNVRLD